MEPILRKISRYEADLSDYVVSFLSRKNTILTMYMYITFFRPVLEYTSVVWDGCLGLDSHQLEKVQYFAATIVTGFRIDLLYFENGSEPFVTEGKQPN
jgi:hypothetical protein